MYGKGWQERDSILPVMTNIVAALCALEAHRAKPDGPPEKVEAEYRKLRQRHFGPTVDKAIKLAAAECSVSDWDPDGMMLGMPDGDCLYITPENTKSPVHNLEQEATDHITQSLATSPTEPTQLWLDFLASLTGKDIMLEHALQVWTAAALLPGNRFHKAHILYGDGNTGKSTYLNVVRRAMGDYAATARSSVFVSEKDNHPAELLPFTQKRLVVLPELPRGALRSDLLKTVTGGDAISVRGMRQNPRTATPTATLMFSANELPSIRLVDNALRRRLLIWPFDYCPETIDHHLEDKLTSPKHIGGVVGWLQAGIIKYVRIQNAGEDMPLPAAVVDATERYFD